MAIKDWQDDWRVPVMNQEMSMDKEVDAGQEKTPARDKMMLKNPKLGQQWNKGGAPKKGSQVGKKNNTQALQEHEKESETTQGTTSSATQ
jgi:hypothetical protein